GLSPHAISKWFNAVSVKIKTDKLEEIKKLPFVDKIEGVHFLEKIGTRGNYTSTFDDYVISISGNKYNYGPTYWQNQQINVPKLHNYGITGYGSRVGMCDDGFNWRNHEALNTRRVLGEFDWIFKDDSTLFQREPNQIPGDAFDQDGHGTATLSTLGGFKEGKLIGPGFDSEFYLSKTEDGRSETPVEEDFWLTALEWMEGRGVDVISSSLIYKPFDPPNVSYDYKDMNGRTTVIVRAAETAAYFGVVVCNSMGNESQTNPPSIVSPPDGDSVFAIGAVDSTGKIAYFSSNGPTSDGRMKPDLVAMGVDVITAVSKSTSGNDKTYGPTGGTSFSCPLTAGVCSLILSAHPELTPMQVMEALKKTSDKKDSPNNVYGWGLVNAYEAALYWGMIISNRPDIITSDNHISISTYVISKNNIDENNVMLYYAKSSEDKFIAVKMELAEKIDGTNSGKYTINLPFSINTDNIKFYISASDSQSSRMQPYNAPIKFFFINQDTKTAEIY
ncbi:MAG: S8 family serine peptidase, partial [Saprospiraceae bacterium]